MTTFFEELGREIQVLWGCANGRECDFPRICAEALARHPPSAHQSIDDVIAESFGPGRLANQVDIDSDFGQPPLCVFANARFFISILFWLDGTTDIHEHAFSGAFHVFHGSSLHTTFSFADERVINEHMKLGSLREEQIEVLKRGDTREINPTGGLIHSLFHLEQPSATVVIRTGKASITRPQYSYHRPRVACSYAYDRHEIKRRNDLMTLVYRVTPERLPTLVLRWLETADFVSAYLGLSHALALLSPEAGDALLARVRERDGTLAALVSTTVEEARREASIIRRRGVVTDPALRFFLAVVLNVRGRTNALRLIEERYPHRNPVDQVLEWVQALAVMPSNIIGESVLGIAVDAIVLDVLRGLLQGLEDAGIVAGLERSLARPMSERDRSAVLELSSALKDSEMFRHVLG